jgi:serine/threonine protein kinase
MDPNPQGRPPQRSGEPTEPGSDPEYGVLDANDADAGTAPESLDSADVSFHSSDNGHRNDHLDVRRAGIPGVLAPGSQFGVYLIGACIGEGGMARIYQAEHAGLRRQVALKLLIDGFARDAEGRERFLREARIAAAIKHPNVVNIFDVGLQDDIPYLVMELLEGKDLEKLLEVTGALDEAMIIDIMVPVVAGLVAVHDAGIVHRDLKPGNIFLARGHHDELEPKLLDFGISTAPGPEQLKLTTNQTLMGTPFYISPEGMLGGEMTPLSDQYSLGVVMYECATGYTPFTGANLSDLSRLITSGQYTPLSTRKPEVSKRLARIIERAMSVEPDKRFKDLRELGRELLTLAGQRTRMTWGLSFGDIKPTLPSRPGGYLPAGASSSPPSPRWRRPGVVALAVAPLLVAALAVAVWRSRSADLESNSSLAPTDVTVPQPDNSNKNNNNNADPGVSRAVPDDTNANRRSSASGPSDDSANTLRAPGPTSNTRDVPPTVVPRPAGGGTDQAVPRRASRPAAPPASQRSAPLQTTELDPDWAIPIENPRPQPTKPGSSGANGAPIFD